MEDRCVIFRCCELDCQLEAVRDDGRMLWWCQTLGTFKSLKHPPSAEELRAPEKAA